jgi:hypothetical protein
MDISKAFRATLPALRDDQMEHLRRWSENDCAHALLFRESSAVGSWSGRVVLMALRDRPRTAASHARTVRAALRRRGIDDTRLRGKWLYLITPPEVLAMGAVDGAQRDARAADGPQRDEDAATRLSSGADADDVRVVPLR